MKTLGVSAFAISQHRGMYENKFHAKTMIKNSKHFAAAVNLKSCFRYRAPQLTIRICCHYADELKSWRSVTLHLSTVKELPLAGGTSSFGHEIYCF